MGGAGGGDADTIPLCRKHHQEAEASAERFEATYRFSMRYLAATLARCVDGESEAISFVLARFAIDSLNY